MRKWIGLGALAPLAACVSASGPAARPAPHIPVPTGVAAVDGILGRDARTLTGYFGRPDAEVIEGVGQKLQFAGPICVLDAYLYTVKGGREPVVTHIDTRQRDGKPIDQASCVAALTHRGR